MRITFDYDLFLPGNREKLTEYVQCKDLQEKIFHTPSNGCLQAWKKGWDVAVYFPLCPFYFITYLFMETISLFPLGKTLSCRVHILKDILWTRFTDFPFFKADGLQFKTVNHPQFTSPLLSFHSRHVKNDQDLEFNPMAKTKKKENLSLKKPAITGICRGNSFLFSFLALQAEKKGCLNKKTLLDIASLFRNGSPDPSVILQGILNRSVYPLLGFDQNDFFYSAKEITLLEDVKNIFAAMPLGIYTVELPGHEVVLVKLEDKWFYFDPSIGPFILDKNQTAEQFLKIIGSYIQNWECGIQTAANKLPPSEREAILEGALRELKGSLITFHHIQKSATPSRGISAVSRFHDGIRSILETLNLV